MSAGNFVDAKYEDDAGNIYDCRVQPETLDLTLNGAQNAIPTGAADQALSARMTGSRRKYGARARSVRVRFTATPPEGYDANSVIELPILRPDRYQTMKSVKKPTGTYLGVAVVGIGFTGESVK